jgi:hypothetical protein
VDRFVGFLGENDLIAAMVFNQEVKLLAKMSANDPLFSGTQEKTVSPPPRVVNPSPRVVNPSPRVVSPPPRPVSPPPQPRY